MLRYFIFLALFLFSASCYAQFTDTTHYSVNYAATGSINKTNDGNTYLINNAAKFGIKEKTFDLNFTNTWVYGKSNEALTNNDFSSTLYFNLYSNVPHFFYWGLANYNTSASLKINNQLLAGAGVAYNIIDKKDAYLNISDGLLFDSSDLILTDNVRDVYQTYRNSLRLAFKFTIIKSIVLNSSSYYQPSLSRKDDYNLKSDSSLAFKLNKYLNLTTAFSYNRASRTDRDNLLFTYGLAFEKFF